MLGGAPETCSVLGGDSLKSLNLTNVYRNNNNNNNNNIVETKPLELYELAGNKNSIKLSHMLLLSPNLLDFFGKFCLLYAWRGKEIPFAKIISNCCISALILVALKKIHVP
jgi:hypothetical protein